MCHTYPIQRRRINSVVASTFEIIKREVFSLPKLAYLPGILVSEPLLVLVLLPANIGLDFARAKVIAHLNRRVLTFAYFIMENPIKMDDLGVPLFLETLIFQSFFLGQWVWATSIALQFGPSRDPLRDTFFSPKRWNFNSASARGIELLRRSIQDISSRRSEMEQHDTNSVEALLRVGASHIAEAKWRSITLQLQEMTLR